MPKAQSLRSDVDPPVHLSPEHSWPFFQLDAAGHAIHRVNRFPRHQRHPERAALSPRRATIFACLQSDTQTSGRAGVRFNTSTQFPQAEHARFRRDELCPSPCQYTVFLVNRLCEQVVAEQLKLSCPGQCRSAACPLLHTCRHTAGLPPWPDISAELLWALRGGVEHV